MVLCKPASITGVESEPLVRFVLSCFPWRCRSEGRDTRRGSLSEGRGAAADGSEWLLDTEGSRAARPETIQTGSRPGETAGVPAGESAGDWSPTRAGVLEANRDSW